MIDPDQAAISPQKHFSDPEQVFREPAFTREQKIRVLHQWHRDLRELQTATDENMGDVDAGGPGLVAVEDALRRLDAAPPD